MHLYYTISCYNCDYMEHHHNPTKRKHFSIAHTIAIGIVSFMLLLGAYTKLSMHPDAVQLFATLHLLPFMKAFGLIQVIIALCLWWRPTRIIGTLVASAYFGAGAIMMLSIHESAITATLLLLLTWLIHKCSWWSMWSHGYHCGCASCLSGDHLLPKDTAMCQCGKSGCRCVDGTCTCE